MTPPSSTEAALTELWRQILDQPEIGPESDFFTLGGSSLQATRLLYQAQERFQVELPLSALADGLTIARMAALIDELRADPTSSAKPERERGEL